MLFRSVSHSRYGANGGVGGGGGSGAITRMTLDASLCPDFLQISVGSGGAGGTGSGSAGTGGGASTVTIPLVGVPQFSVLIDEPCWQIIAGFCMNTAGNFAEFVFLSTCQGLRCKI